MFEMNLKDLANAAAGMQNVWREANCASGAESLINSLLRQVELIELVNSAEEADKSQIIFRWNKANG